MVNVHFLQFAVSLVQIMTAIGQSTSMYECSTTEVPSCAEGISVSHHTGVMNQLQCARACASNCSCDVMSFCDDEAVCDLYQACPGCASAVNVTNKCANNEAPITAIIAATKPCGAHRYLVTGPCGVADSQLSASSYFCHNNSYSWCLDDPDRLNAKWGRLNSPPAKGGSWVRRFNIPVDDYIQVDFLTTKLTKGIVLTGRNGCCDQYVTAFKVSHSSDCIVFTPVYDQLGNEKVFAGVSYKMEVVNRCFDVPILARCIRVWPTAGVGHWAMRFDVLGI